MAPTKRKASQANITAAAPTAKRGRRAIPKSTAATTRPRRGSATGVNAPTPDSSKKTPAKRASNAKNPATKSAVTSKAKLKAKVGEEIKGGRSQNTNGQVEGERSRRSSISVEIPVRQRSEDEKDEDEDGVDDDGKAYWLMKAEPDSRIEKGKDVKFSIDDLRNATEPEGWDGVRNLAARNNMRAMKKGDLAFFYHSNCKIPGIAGIMEIVQEHTTDGNHAHHKSAFDAEHPYHDPKSTRENPKWDKVHVEFRRKFSELVRLKELQKYAKSGGVLEHLQTLKMSRLSVSKVTPKQWKFIMTLVEEEDDLANGGPSTTQDVSAEQVTLSPNAPVARMGAT